MTIPRIQTVDRRVMQRVNRWLPPRWLRVWAMAATRAGDGWLWYGIGLGIALLGGPVRLRALAAAGLAVAAGAVLFVNLKRLCRRQRPYAIDPHCWAALDPPDQFSFPSGHTITAFAMTAALSVYYPAMLPGLLFCAASVALSRILLGMHFLSDVLAGAAIGALLGYAAAALIG